MAAGEVMVNDVPRRPISRRDEKFRWLASSLARSMSAEEIGECVGDALERVLGEPVQPTGDYGSRRTNRLLSRLGLPLLRSRCADAAPSVSADDAVRLRERFVEATKLLVEAAPHHTRTYPTEELRLLIALRATEPAPADVVPYLRRYGLAVLAVLDLMKDDEQPRADAETENRRDDHYGREYRARATGEAGP